MDSSGTQSTRTCVQCGRAFAWDANVCPYCGHDYRVVMAGQPQKKQSAMPVVGGVLIILGSLVYLIFGGLLTAGSSVLMFAGGVACGAIVLVLGIIALLGGIFSIQRKNFALALIGGIFVIPTIIGLIGLILVIVSKDEFN